jgi:plasmid maintenance system antidote protein VapI
MIKELLEQRNMTLYRLSKNSGVPYTTINDLYHGRTSLDRCTAKTVYRLSSTLDISMEEMLIPYMTKRIDFELFKSNVCHRLKELGDISFIIDVLEKDEIIELYRRKWYPESLYLLAMLDYISRINNVPWNDQYDSLRSQKLKDVLYPSSVLALAAVMKDQQVLSDSRSASIAEFMRHNIVEAEVRDVA